MFREGDLVLVRGINPDDLNSVTGNPPTLWKDYIGETGVIVHIDDKEGIILEFDNGERDYFFLKLDDLVLAERADEPDWRI